MSTPTIAFHLDYISPYAYLAWTQIHALAERHGATVRPVPVLFAALLDHHGQKGPAEIPAKRRYVFKEILRRAALLGVPLGPPPTHPFNPLLALRATVAADGDRRLIDALFAGTWGDADLKGVDDAERVAEMANRAGLDGADIVARAQEDDVKAALREQTERAIAAGVFGVPGMLVGEELFWGLDSFDLLERHLAGEDPLDRDALAKVMSIPASASRR